MKRRQLLHAGAAGLALQVLPGALGSAQAQTTTFPSKPVRIIVSVAPGGSADKLARTLAQRLTAQWGQTVVVENVPGAGGAIGTGLAARAAADGHTLLLASDSLAVDVALRKKLAYDPQKDFTGVVKAVVNPMLLVTRPGLGVNNFQDYVKYLKSRPGKVTVALPSGTASLQHLAHELLSARVGVQPNYIPYPGGGPAMLDVLGGHIDAMIITLAAATENVRAGKLIGLGVSTSTRSKALPDVPTIAESGVPGFSVEAWQGFVVPAATPRAIVEKLNRDIVAVLRDPTVSGELEGLGFNISAGGVNDIADTLKATIPVYTKVITDSGIKV